MRDVKIIYFEFHPKYCLRAGYQPREIIDLLKNNQFEIFAPRPKGNKLNLVSFKQQPSYTEKMNLIAFNANM